MALPAIDVICKKCNSHFSSQPERSFLGFQKLACNNCGEKLTYPLTSGYRTTYQILFVMMIFAIIGQFAKGSIGFPGGIGIAIIFALLRDRSIRKQISKLESITAE